MSPIRFLIFSLSLALVLPAVPMADESELNMETWDELQLELVPEERFRVILEPRSRTTLSAEIESVVSVITLRLGEPFYEDDLLIQLDDTGFEATFMKAEALLERAKTELEIREELFADQVASELEVVEARAAKISAEADLILAREQLNATKLTAPYQGKVVNVLVEEHEMVRAGTPLIEIVDDTTLIAKMLIPSRYLDRIAFNAELRITLSEREEPVTAIIKRIGAVIDPASSMVKVEAEIDNSDNLLRAGMIGTTSLDENEADDLPSDDEESDIEEE